MINSKILVSVVIVLMIGVAAAGYQISQTPQLWQLTTPQSSDSSSQGDSQSSSSPSDVVQGQSSGSGSSVSSQGSSNGGSSVKVSVAKAKIIAAKTNDQGYTYLGTPVLKGSSYIVPVISDGNDPKFKFKKGQQIGGIIIDANTGEVTGIEGGVQA
ncbi:MAG: peptidase propeptide domain-containing protein [Methanobacteriaceae archaeon]|jgi:cytoskeletal protein RodZ|nr:peptidase propeptide domain-containing protein [Methanobacteriaceae archaeon]MDO9628054.1 peptidase propeptide domain-containing protein [Methanobacteriaceae archaeon]